MASIHRKLNSRLWHCAYYLPDGRRTMRSTGTSDKAKAKAICLHYEQVARLGKEARLTESRAREAIADIYAIANRESLPSSSIREYLSSWLLRKKLELASGSFAGYSRSVEELLASLGSKAEKSLESVTLRDLSVFRDSFAEKRATGTTNKAIKILRGAWTRALRDGLIRENIFMRLDLVKATKSKRRAFTMLELKRLLAECNDEWRGMVLFGIYTGQRLGDIVRLTWRNVDLENGEIRFATRKTDRSMTLPIAKPLQEYISTLKDLDDPEAPIFPESFKRGTISIATLSNQFSDILASAGLIEKRSHQSIGKGRRARRDVGGLSFHCLRHTATSLLKNAGVSDVVAREIIGHDSEAVSRTYTHIETSSLRTALEKLPDVLNGVTIKERIK